MKITKRQLKHIIQEEVRRVLEKEGTKAYMGFSGMGQDVATSDAAGAASDKCQMMRDQIENITAQLGALGSSGVDERQRTALNDELRTTQQNHDAQCGPQ